MSYSIIDDGHISSPLGFRATGVSAGLKEQRARDLALIYSQQPCRVAAVFTSSALPAAPIFFNQAVLSRNREALRAVLINAGHANAATGPHGLTHAVECAKMVADELEIPRDGVLLLSNGIAGAPLPMPKMRTGIRRAASELDSGGGRRAALAIQLGDARPKERALRIGLGGGRTVTLAGIASGLRIGQLGGNATLAVLTTDAQIDMRLLTRSLEQSVTRWFGRLLIDSDNTPGDAVLLFANGTADATPIAETDVWAWAAWQEALDALCADLAIQIARDAAPGGRLIHFAVRGAASDAIARQLAAALARSRGARWALGRGQADCSAMLAVVGACGIEVRPDLIELHIGRSQVLADGTLRAAAPDALATALAAPEIDIVLDLHLGSGQAVVTTCTLGGSAADD